MTGQGKSKVKAKSIERTVDVEKSALKIDVCSYAFPCVLCHFKEKVKVSSESHGVRNHPSNSKLKTNICLHQKVSLNPLEFIINQRKSDTRIDQAPEILNLYGNKKLTDSDTANTNQNLKTSKKNNTPRTHKIEIETSQTTSLHPFSLISDSRLSRRKSETPSYQLQTENLLTFQRRQSEAPSPLFLRSSPTPSSDQDIVSLTSLAFVGSQIANSIPEFLNRLAIGKR